MKIASIIILFFLGSVCLLLAFTRDSMDYYPSSLIAGAVLIFVAVILTVNRKRNEPSIENKNADERVGDKLKNELKNSTQLDSRERAPYVSELAKYYRDFLETSFHKRREPKRAIRYRDQKNFLLGFNLRKYEFFANRIWALILKGFPPSEEMTISKGQFISKIPIQLQSLIQKQVESLREESIQDVVDQGVSAIRKGADTYQLRPLVAYDFSLAEISTLLRERIVRPFITTVYEALISQASWDEEIIAVVEDSLTEALFFSLREEIPELVNSVIAGENIDLHGRFSGIFNRVFVTSTLLTFFGDLALNDLYLDLQELMRNERLLDKQELYLYFGDISFNKKKYPIFYIPLELEKVKETIKVTFDSTAFINKKALDYIVQEFRKLREKAGAPREISDRLIYLEEERERFFGKIQDILIDILDFFELPHDITLTKGVYQVARGVGVSISNACHLCIFDKSDEAIINDYEEILESLKLEDEETGTLFNSFVTHFIEDDPMPVNEEVESEWDNLPSASKLVYRSPVPLNEEQRKILLAIKNKKCQFVAVQGPPGTGKSHTITAILCDAILRNDSVLVLSDKKEALDVVENKVTEVINSIRLGDDFQNPILRLGKTGDTYTKILSASAIGGIEEAHRSSRRNEAEREKQLQTIEADLHENLNALASGYKEVNVEELTELCSLENELREKALLFCDVNELIHKKRGIKDFKNLKNQCEWHKSHFGPQGTFLDTENVMRELEIKNFSQATLEYFLMYIELAKKLNSEIEIQDKKGKSVKAITLFNQFHSFQLSGLRQKLRECDALKENWLARLWRRKEIRQLTESFYQAFSTNMRKSILHNYEDLNTALDIFQWIIKKRPPRLMGGEGGLDYLNTIHYLLVNHRGQLKHIDTEGFRNFLRIVENFEREFPHTYSCLGITHEDGKSFFENKLILLREEEYKKLERYLSLYSKYHHLFDGLPQLDFLRQKKQLESLVTETMANGMDGQVVKFFHESRATAQTIRSIIRKKQKFPKEDFEKLRQAFPCIIAGIRDFSDYIPLDVGLFDVVIIDEASQVSVAQALPAIVRGKNVVVLGDTKQFSNLQSSLAKGEVNQEYIKGLEEMFKQTGQSRISQMERLRKLNIKTSILELFEFICNFHITLLKHSRGYRELISYSSKHFYNGRLQAVKIRVNPIDEILKFTFVEHDGKTEKYKNTNKLEIDAIKAELQRLKENGSPGTIGIITPFHDQQILISDEMNKLKDRDYFFEKRKLKIMTFDTCQGEERDTVLYSMVATREEDKLNYIFPSDLSRSFYAEEEGKIKVQRLNVGFSRAKECMHFILSKPLEDYKGAIRGALLHFWNELQEGQRLPEAKDTDPSSPMEPQVLEWIKSTNFIQNNLSSIHLEAQFPVGEYLRQLDRTYTHPKYRTDFLLWYRDTSGQEHKIIIEYDGFHHFVRDTPRSVGSYQEYYSDKDLEREKTLESYGYKFLRLNRFNLGKDPIMTLDQRLSELVGSSS